MAVVISDSSPLVHLSAISRFELLRALYVQLTIPTAVWNEVTVQGRGRPGERELRAAIDHGWIEIRDPIRPWESIPSLARLDPGEAEALALALDLDATLVIMDELRGRSAARELGIPIIGTLGILLEAKRQNLIPSFKDELTRLRDLSQLTLSDEIAQRAIELSGE